MFGCYSNNIREIWTNAPIAAWSYADCEDEELKTDVLNAFGCMVPWLSGKNQCSKRVERRPEHNQLKNRQGRFQGGDKGVLPPPIDNFLGQKIWRKSREIWGKKTEIVTNFFNCEPFYNQGGGANFMDKPPTLRDFLIRSVNRLYLLAWNSFGGIRYESSTCPRPCTSLVAKAEIKGLFTDITFGVRPL